MNIIQNIFASLSDAELRAAIRDVVILDETGILPAGPVRELAARVANESGIPTKDALALVQRESIRIAAFKWAAS